jgi:cytochrome c biogenesis protein CcmG/thiol:disulfide interchange protein DsbE
LAVLALLGLFVWGLGRRGTVGQVPVATRPAPDFELVLFGQAGSQNGSWRLSSLAGKPVVVNFWASWCLPCEDEAAVLESVARRYRDQVTFVGVDVQDTEQNARGFLQRYQVSYANGPDPSGEVSIAYGMSGVPETYFIGRDQMIIRKWAGPLDEPKLVQFLDELLS